METILKGNEVVGEFVVARDDSIQLKDYKDVLNEVRESVVAVDEYIDRIKQVNNLSVRAIAAMLICGISVVEIADLMQKSKMQIYRYINNDYKNGKTKHAN
ncbi:hypothetical protein MBAV_005770 [Candidatus Magnetobacterium bavaricum]|uniref:Uncharacterized protein n=1 Tax=Candidatus Magnetobacterium bavaricum TaxID=29290 RepID=A0A0F3GJC6_9BACT|nr:hypothetical protein MBAV_005770 [Candidatus Magnetobacterium bavaricum]